jgi:hypothetical protein
MSAYDPEPRGGRTATAVLLAVALLAVLGAAVGYLLGVRYNDSTPKADPSPAAALCPDVTQHDAAAQGAVPPLTVRLHVVTKSGTDTGTGSPYRSEVWICVAAAAKGESSTLWFQGHRIKHSLDEEIVNDQANGNGILLHPANALSDGKYRATNTDATGTTTYVVSPTALLISGPHGNSTEVVVPLPPR